MATEGIKNIANSWKETLELYGISTSIVSVFCHQRPIVKHNLSEKNPEIGDLLIVHVYHPKKGKSKRTALLLQAKMKTLHTANVKSNDHQFLLYNNWPEFSFVKPIIKGININIVPNQAHQGAKYLLIDNKNHISSFSFTYTTAEVDNTLIPLHNLAHTMLKILLFEEGKEFIGRKQLKIKKIGQN
ncbi:hypothetical protein [Jeotgalibacillus salarius]|uniref:Uncharacterized protein n=1 Tax=Jeotgalibacillus salarius TaxID=546023 RepID=A0A4Y8LHY3_9BACL|nr:hypothetical protein [Jeotgalibacillus salarius]TFE00665.1 hypothetical protein E2626_11880 [Jeotgalibacillus salarius]